MKLVGSFFKFAQRVLDAAKKGGLSKMDIQKLEMLMTSNSKRYTTLAKGLLTALDVGGASKEDISRFGQMLEAASVRMAEKKDPFTKAERTEIADIFDRAYMSPKTKRFVENQMNSLLAREIGELATGKKFVFVPKRKTLSQDEKKKLLKV